MRRFGWLLIAVMAVSAGCSKKQDTPAATAQSRAQTQPGSTAEPSQDLKIPDGPLDGNWFMKAGDQMRYGTHEGLMNCMEKEKGIHVFLSGTVDAINQQIVRYYKSHPREVMLEAALKELGHNPAAEAKLQESLKKSKAESDAREAAEKAKATTARGDKKSPSTEANSDEPDDNFLDYENYSNGYWTQNRDRAYGFVMGSVYCRTGVRPSGGEVIQAASGVDDWYKKYSDDEHDRTPVVDVMEMIGTLPVRK